MRIAVFGGTFNPIHNGHINLVVSAIEQLKLDKVILIPNSIPPHKPIPNGVTNQDRLNMCCLAAECYDKIEVSDIEIKKIDISYTVETLQILKKLYQNDEFYLLIGSDMFFSFLSWKKPMDILKLVKLYVVPRNKNEIQKIKERCLYFYSIGMKIGILDIEPVLISSTIIREKIFLSENVSKLLPYSVAQYIKKYNLYQIGGRKYDGDI